MGNFEKEHLGKEFMGKTFVFLKYPQK